MESPVYEEREPNIMLIYITITTPILVVAIAMVTYVAVWLQDSMDARGREALLFLGPPAVIGGLVGMAAMWHLALSRQPFRVFPDRIEPTHRAAMLGLRGQRHSIRLSEISKCDVFDVADSWGKPAFRRFELTLTSGGEVTVYVPEKLGAQAEVYFVEILKRTGVPVETYAMSMNAWIAEWRRRKSERRRVRRIEERSPPN